MSHRIFSLACTKVSFFSSLAQITFGGVLSFESQKGHSWSVQKLFNRITVHFYCEMSTFDLWKVDLKCILLVIFSYRGCMEVINDSLNRCTFVTLHLFTAQCLHNHCIITI